MRKIKPKPLVIKGNPSLLDMEIRNLSPRQRKSKGKNMAKHLIKEGYEVNHRKKWFQTGFGSLNEIPVPARYYARQLLRLGYTHQLKLI